MMCLSPMSIPRPNGLGSIDRISVPCGKCLPCLSNKRSEWSFRLEQEFLRCKGAKFLTLTYDEIHEPWGFSDGDNTWVLSKDLTMDDFSCMRPQLVKKHLQLYFKSLRKKGYKFRYYAVGEYGTKTKRPHYHAIVFDTLGTLSDSDVVKFWTHGFIKIGSVNSKSINYVTKYCITKQGEFANLKRPFSIMSLKPAIGSNYLENASEWHENTKNRYALHQGTKINLPRYFKDKLFTGDEKLTYNEDHLKHIDDILKKSRENLIKAGNDMGLYQLGLDKQYKEKLKKITKNETL
jgi:hypothetical protein